MNLEQIINEDAQVCANVTVKICRRFPTVTISDEKCVNHNIFMQGDSASLFIEEFDDLLEEAPDVLLDSALRHLARQYVDVFWKKEKCNADAHVTPGQHS